MSNSLIPQRSKQNKEQDEVIIAKQTQKIKDLSDKSRELDVNKSELNSNINTLRSEIFDEIQQIKDESAKTNQLLKAQNNQLAAIAAAISALELVCNCGGGGN